MSIERPTLILTLGAMLATTPAAAQPRVATGEEQAHADSSPTRAVVLHVPPTEATARRRLRLVAVVDGAWTEADLVVRFRKLGDEQPFDEATFERSSAGGYFATIPATAVTRPGLQYYIAGKTPAGEELLHFASSETPHTIRVEPSQAARWAQKERRRLNGYLSTLRAEVNGHNFGNRHGKNDQYLRGELEWSHRLILDHVYSISLGYGFIEGRTPVDSDRDASVMNKGARYGYGGILFRLHRSVWLETQAGIGVDRDGFITSASGKLTLSVGTSS